MTMRLGGEYGGMPQPYELAHDSELRLLLAYSSPPRAGRITAENSGSYTVEIADGENATVEAVPLNGFAYAVGDVVYVLQAANAPDSGLIVGRTGHATRLGIGAASPDGPLHVWRIAMAASLCSRRAASTGRSRPCSRRALDRC